MNTPRIRTVSWCEARGHMAEDVQLVRLGENEPWPEWGTHACTTCRQRLDLTAVPRQPHRAVRIQ